MLAALGIYDNIWPPYAANVVLEIALCGKTGDHYIRALYNDEARPLGDKQKNEGTMWLRFQDFTKLMRELVPENYEAECRCVNDSNGDLSVTEDGISSTIGTTTTTTATKK